MKTPTAARVASLLLLLAAFPASAGAGAFSAELVDTQGGQTRTGPFHYQDKSVRFELGGPGQALVLIVDGATGTTRLLNPAEKAYHEAGPGEPLSLFANPCAFYAQYAHVKEVRTEGTESVAGIPCQKQVVFSGEQVYVTAWVAEGYDLPLKVHVPLGDRTVELRNLKPGPQDAALFAVPAGYRLEKVEERREPQPEWAGQVASAPLLTPPLERKMAAGDIVRIRPQAGRWISLEATNVGPAQGSVTTLPFKDGKYIGGGSMSTLILDAGDSSGMSQGVSPDKADALVVRVVEGTMKIKAAYVAPSRSGAGEPTAPAEPAPASPAGEIPAELSAPESTEVAMRLEVSWQGPAGRDDFIAIARPNQAPGAFVERTLVREGNPVKVWTPSDPGDYELRYVVPRGAQVLARAPLAVTAVSATVTPAGPVNVAAWLEVKWDGPARDGDYVSVATAGQAPGAFLGRTPVRDGNPLKLRAPSDAGTFEVRYVLGRGNRLLAKAPVTVNAVTAEVTPPATATAGTEFEVAWQGPGYPEDLISIARPNQPPNAHLSSATIRKGNPLKLRAPKEPGTYEVRYLLGRGPRLLAKASVTIAAPAPAP
jgi:hypothetical protein